MDALSLGQYRGAQANMVEGLFMLLADPALWIGAIVKDCSGGRLW